ncbi:methylmalonyl-CoA mutase [Puniceicoccales bacterium CK1056]|uniref:methylmalonyl-CoA mutase n=1 Tax=Oceanipulchritudo coccoides TaxID=2706888 RepID=A0A6B2M3D4_9BACT|nr:acyl-CoA mutase large subunit family protein [Oceanipulchritudo coccoides]NDV62822.1 methylmalonyl-CoA mutase [Oceanipulchritudo coccoides]
MESDKTTRLLSEFPSQTYEEWKEAAVKLLKGRPFEKTLITPTYEGFDLQPIYMRETMADFPHLGDTPGTGSQVRGSRLEGYVDAGWLISQELSAPTAKELNTIARHELENGQNELNVWFDRPTREGQDASAETSSVGVCGVSLSALGDLKVLLEGIHPEMISLNLQSGAAAPAIYALLDEWVRESGTNPEEVRGCLGMDPAAWLAETGALPGEKEKVFDVMAELIQAAAKRLPQLQILDIQGHAFHNGGASSAQELAAVLAAGANCLKELAQRGVPAELVVPRMRLSVSIGGNYFIEIGKLRALRLLWTRILEAYGVSEAERKVHLHARTGLWNKTRFDPYVNMLRTTTEAFSAVVGGCDSLHVAPFDEIIRESDGFSRRIARNTHAILAEECGLTNVIDPAGGSYAVETITDEMAAAAWKQFQAIEAAGGILAALESGTLQEDVAQVYAAKIKNIQRRKDVIVGTNSYPNASEKLLGGREIDYEAVRIERIATVDTWKSSRDDKAVQEALANCGKSGSRIESLVEAARAGATVQELMAALELGQSDIKANPIGFKRAAEEYENLRLAARELAEAGRPARIHQLNMGPSRRYRIRADWTSSFFQVAGFELLNEDDYADIDTAVAALKESGAKAAIITSDDETYSTTVEALAAAISELDAGIKILVAGAPGDNEEKWRAAGVDDFVNIRVNNYSFNRALLESMGASL